jgi:hypothetical protein
MLIPSTQDSRGRLGQVERYQMFCPVPTQGDRLAQLCALRNRHWMCAQSTTLEDQSM